MLLALLPLILLLLLLVYHWNDLFREILYRTLEHLVHSELDVDPNRPDIELLLF